MTSRVALYVTALSGGLLLANMGTVGWAILLGLLGLFGVVAIAAARTAIRDDEREIRRLNGARDSWRDRQRDADAASQRMRLMR